MPSAADLANFKRQKAVNQTENAQMVPKVPELPEDVVKRFPSLKEWHMKMEEWRVKTNIAIRGGPS